jgi:sensor domain CHASE-containing protein
MNATEREVASLTAEWKAANHLRERRATDFNDAAEQVAWDALVDFVEAHDLTYTEHDPRGAA